MKQEWKDKWIAALRSGEYKQGNAVLRSEDNKFCCLGVLCDLVIKENPKLNWYIDEEICDYEIDGETEFPPQEIYDITGELEIDESELAALNDVERLSFKQIADVIEAGEIS